MFKEVRKGQEGLTLTTLLLIVLGIVVVVIIIVGANNGFDFIFGKIKILPGQSLEASIQACNVAAQQSLKADYCSEFKEVEINGKEQYVTCNFLGEGGYLEQTLECGSLTVDDSDIDEYCINEKLNEDDLVENRLCSDVSRPAADGNPLPGQTGPTPA